MTSYCSLESEQEWLFKLLNELFANSILSFLLHLKIFHVIGVKLVKTNIVNLVPVPGSQLKLARDDSSGIV